MTKQIRNKIKKVAKGLKKASKTHARQAKTLRSVLKTKKAKTQRLHPTLVGQDPVLIPIKVEPQPKIYTAGTLEATEHPMDVANGEANPTPVQYHGINDRNPAISLSVGTIHLAGS